MSPSSCPECGSHMELAYAPSIIWYLTIPFTKLEIQVWNWGREEYQCIHCASERHDEPFRNAYNAGIEDGYRADLQ